MGKEVAALPHYIDRVIVKPAAAEENSRRHHYS